MGAFSVDKDATEKVDALADGEAVEVEDVLVGAAEGAEVGIADADELLRGGAVEVAHHAVVLLAELAVALRDGAVARDEGLRREPEVHVAHLRVHERLRPQLRRHLPLRRRHAPPLAVRVVRAPNVRRKVALALAHRVDRPPRPRRRAQHHRPRPLRRLRIRRPKKLPCSFHLSSTVVGMVVLSVCVECDNNDDEFKFNDQKAMQSQMQKQNKPLNKDCFDDSSRNPVEESFQFLQ